MDRPGFKLTDRSLKLLETIVAEDLEAFSETLKECQLDEINKFHGFPHDVTCLMLSIQKGLVRFVQLLLEAGAEVNDSNPSRKVSSIHLAIRTGNQPDILDLLLRFGVNVNLREGHGRTALHVLLTQWIKEDQDEGSLRWPFFNLLISEPAIDVNAEDKDGTTPLELAVRKGLTKVVNKLLQAGAVVNQHVREAMEEHMPDLLAEYPEEESSASNNNPVELTGDYLESELYKALRNGDVDRFQLLVDTVHLGNTNVNLSTTSSTHNPTLLQYSCEWQVTAAVATLITAGVNPNQTSYNTATPPVILASLKGNVEILRLLAGHKLIQLDAVDNPQSRQTALHKISQKLHDSRTVEERNRYSQCLQILLARHQEEAGPASINVNAQDAFGNTALHYAAYSGVEEAIIQLLRSGAHIGLKNNLGETAVKRILPSTLESFLDSCVRVPEGEEVTAQNYSVTFDYSLLAPPVRSTDAIEGVVSYQNNHETAAESVNLNSPPSADFSREKILPECEALWHLSRSSKHQYLLKHPLVTSFLMLKWHNIRFFYYFNVLIYTLHVLVCSTYILLLHSGYDSDPAKVSLSVLWYCVLFFVTILLARELFQLGIAPLRYLFSAENYVELVMLGCTCAVLAQSDDPTAVRHLSALAILLAWTEGLLLLGRHPRLSIFVTMFTTVSTKFFYLLLWYSILLIGFALSFFLVFGPPAPPKKEGDEEAAGGGFADIPGSLLKVSAMMTGELEFGDLPFDANPWTSRLIFLAFLFLITIVLLNLLNGLAVSDTQAIQSKAETIGYVSRVELISYMESMLLGDPFDFLADWPPFKFIRSRCPSSSPLTNLMRGSALRSIIRAEDTVLFFKCLPNKTFTVYPHRKINSLSSDPEQRRICSCHAKFRLDEQIIQSASQRAQENQQRSLPDEKQFSSAYILAEIDKLQASVLLLQNQNSKLIQMLVQQSGGKLDE